MKLIDSHAHLQSNCFSKKLNSIVDSSLQMGIEAIINCSTSLKDMTEVLNLHHKYPILIPAAGIHPWYINPEYRSIISHDFSFLENFPVIGEIGLDKKYSSIPIEIQLEVFEYFLKAAVETNKPATIHCIGAFDELKKSIKKIGTPSNGLVIHAYNGSKEQAKELSKLNIFFSIGGVSTYRDSKKREDMINYIFPELMMLETDSPDIIPADIKSAEKNSINEPKNLIYILNAVSDITGKSKDIVAEKTTTTAKRIFNL